MKIPITLLDLATDTSGLPVVPSNMAPKDMKDPYADYTVEQLFAYLPDAKLNGPVGKKYEYSNTGLGLLGQALARRAGTDYDSLLRTRVLQPLGLSDTSAGPELGKDKRAAVGHDAALEPVPNWHLQAIAPAGGLRSNVNDLLTFLAAHMEKNATPLSASAALATEHRRPTDTKHVLALGWHVATAPNGQEIVWHNGGTAGFQSFMGSIRRRRPGSLSFPTPEAPPPALLTSGCRS